MALEPASSSPVSPKEFHIFGNGISFSISPVIHNAGFKHDSLPYTYDIRESPDMSGVASLIEAPNFGGASITMPHKLQAERYCDRQTDTARLIGAINTLIVEHDEAQQDKRAITGDNTDWSGLTSLVEAYANKTGKKLKRGLVIGAGGASRAALYAMHRAGLQSLYIHNRTIDKAKLVRDTFASVMDVTVLSCLEHLPEVPDVIIGTVPADQTAQSQFDGIFINKTLTGSSGGGLCIEMSYKPRLTPLIMAARQQEGWETITGIQVLLAQAFDQYRLWTGREAPREVMIKAVEAHEAKLSKLS
jgi:shikimate-5-dehydrogenase